MKRFSNIEAIIFDADDTLWDCQSHFANVERQYCDILSEYGQPDEIAGALFRTEAANMELLGYGTKAFTLSLVENAVAVSRGKVPATTVGKIIDMGKSLLQLPAEPLPGVTETLKALHGRRLVLFTKGELLDQQNKLSRSGLRGFFERVSIVADKTEEEYVRLCRLLNVAPERVLMVGNSFRSDIAPALAIGAAAAHIPFHVTWQLELTDEYEHERLVRLSRFTDITDILA
ncbi:MAG: HAD family hydrolase [Prevotella sp.]